MNSDQDKVNDQVNVNRNDISWMKANLKRLADHMERQTVFLMGIIIEIFLGIVALIVIAI